MKQETKFQDDKTKFSTISVELFLPLPLIPSGVSSTLKLSRTNIRWGDLIKDVEAYLFGRFSQVVSSTCLERSNQWKDIKNVLRNPHRRSDIVSVTDYTCGLNRYTFKDKSNGALHSTAASSEAEAKKNVVYLMSNGKPRSAASYQQNSARLQLVRSDHPDYDSVHLYNLSKDLESYIEKGEFYVFNPKGSKPSATHGSFQEAATEATRLAERNPKENFHVLKKVATATGSVQTELKLVE